MARRLSWSDVMGGVIATVVITVIVFATLKYSRLGTLHGDTFVLYARVSQARGLLKGSEVWLSGQKIGKVTDIQFLSPSVADTSARIQITMQALEKHRAAIRRDAIAQIRPGGSFIGSPVVYISPGTPGAPAFQPGDVVSAQPQPDAEGAAAQFSVASRQFPEIINNVKLLAAQMSGTGGTAGAMLNASGGNGLEALPRLRSEVGRLGVSLRSGTIGGIMSGTLMRRAGVAMARVDSVRSLLSSQETSLGRIRRDSTLLTSVGELRDELSIIRAQLDGSAGTAGRAMHDSALTNGLAEAERQMTLLFADIKKHPFRYIKF